jgi:deoxyribonuclease-1
MSDVVKFGCAAVAILAALVVFGTAAMMFGLFKTWDEVGGEHEIQGPISTRVDTPVVEDAPKPGEPPAPKEDERRPKGDGTMKIPTAKDVAARTGKVGAMTYPDVPVARRGNTKLESFSGAKRELMKIHGDRPRTLYCGCGFDVNKSIDLRECGYRIRKNEDRAARVEFEHVVPASDFGNQLDAWTKGHPKCVRSGGKKYKGRRCAEKASREFELMQADMHNLQPAVGEVNGDRLNYVMAELEGEPREYGKCDVEIRDQKIEPRPSVRGDIARAYFYMDWAYPQYRIIPDPKTRAMFERWAEDDPVDSWERKRARRIAEAQGNTNPFVE